MSEWVSLKVLRGNSPCWICCVLQEWAARESLGMSGGAPSYIFYWELGTAAPGRCSLPGAAECAAALEEELCTLAPSYCRARGAGKLTQLEVRLVAPGAFAALRELAVSQGATAGQYKPPVVLSRPAQASLLDARVLAQSAATS